MIFPVVMHRYEKWTIKKTELQRIDVFEFLEKTLDSPLDDQEIKPVNTKRDQPWIVSGRTDAEAEIPTLWPSDAERRRVGKDPDAEKD